MLDCVACAATLVPQRALACKQTQLLRPEFSPSSGHWRLFHALLTSKGNRTLTVSGRGKGGVDRGLSWMVPCA